MALSACTGGLIVSPSDEDAPAGGRGSPGSGGVGGEEPEGPGGPSYDGTSELRCDPELGVAGRPRLWRLTTTQLAQSLRGLLGSDVALPEEFFKAASTSGFANAAFDLRVRETEADALGAVVQSAVADTVSKRFDALYPCGEAKAKDSGCKGAFVKTFGAQAFRRPLENAEVTRFTALYDAGVALSPRLGVRAVVEAMLQSPKFLFRSELGKGDGAKVRLTGHEIASALSFQLTNAPPDEALTAAAADGQLDRDEGVRAQAMRLLETHAGARSALTHFFLQLLEYENVATSDRDEALFPDWKAARGDVAQETSLFIEDVVFAGDGTLKSLLTAPYTFMNENVAKLYGASVSGSAFTKKMLDPKQRAGLLTQPGLMAQLSVFERTSPVNRGRWVRERLLCHEVPAPPGNVDTTIPELSEGLTRRQQLEEKTKPVGCAACHGLMNDLGFGLENIDAIGRWRDKEENGAIVDARGKVTETMDANGDFNGPAELAQRLAGSQQVQQCLTVQMARYHFGRFEEEADGCSLRAAYEAFAKGNFDVRKLAVALVTSEAFLYRKK